MRYTIFTFLILFLISSNISLAQKQKISITFESASLVYNNSVGNEWSTSATVNNKYLFRRDSVHINVTNIDEFTIKASAKESDKYSDYGSNKKRINIADINKKKPTNIFINVIVREDRGRYAGNTARWKFKFKIKFESY